VLVRVGRLLKSHGVRGAAKCSYTTDDPEAIPSRTDYVLCDPRSDKTLAVRLTHAELREQFFYAEFDAFSNPEAVKPYSGWDIMYELEAVERTDPDEFYFFELEGLEVRTPDGRVLGRVDKVIDSGAHVLLEVEALGGRLLPFTAMYVPEVNLEQGYLVSSYPLEPEGGEG
jgi:16S rRNA processing protein RimM